MVEAHERSTTNPHSTAQDAQEKSVWSQFLLPLLRVCLPGVTHTRACEFDTRGLLQRAHIIANWPPIYIGKEHDRHFEEGEDLSLLEFKAIEYSRKGNAITDAEQLARIAKVPKREFMRRGINQHTLEKICRREPVRAIKLAKCLKALEEYESGIQSMHDRVEPAHD